MSAGVRSLRRAGILGAAALGGYAYNQDEGLQRSAYFWTRVMPIYLHYRWVQSKVQHLPDLEQDQFYEPLHVKYAPVCLEIILHLRGFYIKIGQIASTRHDFLPSEYIERVGTLQDQVPSEDFKEVKKVIESSLGKPLEEVFEWFDEEPLGAASIGQVHHAKLKDGREVAVKIMYPKVEKLFRTDIKTIKRFCKLAQPEQLPALNEIEKQFATEFDYELESKNLQMIRKNMLKRYHELIVVPEPLLSTPHVLIMEYLPGQKFVDALKKNMTVVAQLKGTTAEALMAEIKEEERRGKIVAGPSSREVLAWRRYLRIQDFISNAQVTLHNYLLRPALLFTISPKPYANTPLPLNLAALMELLLVAHGHQILKDGSFNGDPHPGNILLLPPASPGASNRLGLVDCGQVKHITLEQRIELAKLILAIARKDKEAVVKQYCAMGFRTKYSNPDVIYKHACAIFDRDDKESCEGMNIQLYLEHLNKLDPIESISDDYVLAGRVAILLRGLGYALKYRFSLAKMWEPIARELLLEYGEEIPPGNMGPDLHL